MRCENIFEYALHVFWIDLLWVRLNKLTSALSVHLCWKFQFQYSSSNLKFQFSSVNSNNSRKFQKHFWENSRKFPRKFLIWKPENPPKNLYLWPFLTKTTLCMYNDRNSFKILQCWPKLTSGTFARKWWNHRLQLDRTLDARVGYSNI